MLIEEGTHSLIVLNIRYSFNGRFCSFVHCFFFNKIYKEYL